jgi:hypothetical protein
MISTPSSALPSLDVPVTFVPMKFPWTRFPVVPASSRETPFSRLPEMRLRAPTVAPPIRLSAAPATIETPWRVLLRAAVPSTVVPM